MSDQAEAERGRQAQAVLDNPIFEESFRLLDEEFTRQWKDSRNRDEREEIHQKLVILGKVKAIVEGFMRSGKVADAKLKEKQTLIQRTPGRIRGRINPPGPSPSMPVGESPDWALIWSPPVCRKQSGRTWRAFC